MFGRERDADTGADVDMMAVEIVRGRHGFQKPAGHRDYSFPLIAVRSRQDGEFVTAKPRYRIGFSNACR